MNRQQHATLDRFESATVKAGLTLADADQLRRDAMILHRIAEHECNGTMETCEDTGRVDHAGRPMIVGGVYCVYGMGGPGPMHYYRTADRGTPARGRIEATAARIGATVEFQGDPRGWPVSLTLADGRTTLSPPM